MKQSLLAFSITALLLSACSSLHPSTHPSDAPLVYRNAEFGLMFYLPDTWRGYSVPVQQWQGHEYVPARDEVVATDNGPIIVLRHPHWQASDRYQDIPISVFTRSQWETHHAGTIGAGGVDLEVGHNAKFVFAVHSRFNADDSINGWKEATEIVERNRISNLPSLYPQ